MKKAEEYMSVLTSLELSALFARIENRPVNTVVRSCCDSLLRRVIDSDIRAVITGVKKQAFPVGAVAMLRRQLDSMVTNGKMD